MIEILPVNDQIYGERDLVLADRAREFDLVRMRFRPRNPVGGFFSRILKADLDMIESSIYERFQPLLVESDSGCDEVGVKSRGCARQRSVRSDRCEPAVRRR